MSRQLHDEVGGSIASVLTILELLEGYWHEQDTARAAAKMNDARRTLHRALGHVKDLALSLRVPTRAESADADAGIAEEAEKGASFPPPSAHRMEGEEVFAILREAVRNAISHSAAEHITVQLSASGGELTVSVEDDGNGLGLAAIAAPTSLGLQSMRERAALLGGTFCLTRGASGGTRVHVRVPLDRLMTGLEDRAKRTRR